MGASEKKKVSFKEMAYLIIAALKSGIRRADCQDGNSQAGKGTTIMRENVVFRETFILLLRSFNLLDESH